MPDTIQKDHAHRGSYSTDALIVGAGPTGLTLACALLMHGVSIRVLDRAKGPASTSRALILNARGVEVLDRVGALGGLPGRALSAIKTDFHFGGRTLTMKIGEVAGAARSALVISQAEIEAELRRRLTELGGEIEWDTELVDAIQDDEGVTATLDDGETIRAGWMVGCDGAHSRVRKILGVGFPGVKLAERFLLADVRADGMAVDRGGTAAWFTPNGALLAFPMHDVGGADDLWRLIADLPLAENEDLGEEEILAEFRRLLPERAGIEDVHIRSAEWTSTFRVHRRLADEYRRGRMLLAGDSAHIHSLIGGQGMNTGVGDAENLAWKLALVVKGRAEEALLDTYEAERRPLATEVLRGTTAATRLLFSDNTLVRLLLDRVVVPLVQKPWIQHKITAAGTQLGISYRRGPLAGRAIVGRRPRPGDRVKDLPCVRSDGTRARLHAELGGRWVLLAAEGSADALVAAASKRLGDSLVEFAAIEDGSGEVMLVRPDAHLAWRGPPGSVGLERWLEGALRRGEARG